VIGTDLSPIQPIWTPPNCSFQLDDASLDWTFADNTFDFIHIRCLLGSIKDWVKVYRECYRCLKPGGWLEHTDFGVESCSDDNTLPENCAWHAWTALFRQAGKKMGWEFEFVDTGEFVDWMIQAGFADVNLHKSKMPVGSWPADPRWKEVGILNKMTTGAGLEGYALYICTRVLGWDYNECQLLLVRVRQALKNRAYHAYYRW
jgi:SAM-dependent methyltransferase